MNPVYSGRFCVPAGQERVLSKGSELAHAEALEREEEAAGAREAAGRARRVRRSALSRYRERRRLVEQRAEALRLEQAPLYAGLEIELREDLLRHRVARLVLPLLA